MKAGGRYPDWPEIPVIENEHLADARLHANRKSLLASLPIPRGGKIAEIGVWQGSFSVFLAGELAPRQFFAFDLFDGHKQTNWHGHTGAELFGGLTHRQYYEQAMAAFRGITVLVEGASAKTMRDYTDGSFDLVYLDGDHFYEGVSADAALAVEMASQTGFLVFNDYTLINPGRYEAYGVVPVVNDLVVNRGWRIAGYSLHEYLFCDIALRRA
jgi:hypothetical protein